MCGTACRLTPQVPESAAPTNERKPIMSDMTPPAESSQATYQAKAMAEVKKAASQLYTYLDKYAGTWNKDEIVKVQVTHHMGTLVRWLPIVISGRDMRGSVPTAWMLLEEAYDNGNGSWTNCLPFARDLNLALQQAES